MVAVALGLGGAVAGAFADRSVKAVLAMERDEEPLCLIPIGRV